MITLHCPEHGPYKICRTEEYPYDQCPDCMFPSPPKRQEEQREPLDKRRDKAKRPRIHPQSGGT